MDATHQQIADRLLEVVARVPLSDEPKATDPGRRAGEIARRAARRTGAIAGALSLPVGPAGMLTVLPDLVMTWRVQAQMVADIAAAFGKSETLTREQLIYCLFEHGAVQSLSDFATRVGERYVVRRATLGTFRTAAMRVGAGLARRSVERSIARFLPLVGAVGVAWYAYRDTMHVQRTAVALFEREITLEPGA